MTHPARLVIIDEPSLLLSYPYQQRLLSLIQEWRQQGIAVLFGSDNVDHLMAVTDRILVLRHGRLIAEHRTDETDHEAILAAMVGAAGQQQLTPIIWALDSYYRAREQAEKLHQRQSLLERELETHDVLNHQLIDQLADQIDALDRTNMALQDAQRRLLIELEQERKRLASEIHDQVIQDLLGVGYRLEEIEADFSRHAHARGGAARCPRQRARAGGRPPSHLRRAAAPDHRQPGVRLGAPVVCARVEQADRRPA